MRKDWEVKKLGEICTIQLGKTPYRENPKFWDKDKTSGNVWLSISDLKHGKYIYESTEQISDLGAKNVVKIPQGTILISFKLTLGRVSFAGCDLYTNEAIVSLLNLSSKINKEYLFYYFSFFDWDKATEGDIKVKGKTLNKKKLNDLKIVIPPLSEQQRIVSVLDKCFTAINKTKANTEQNLKNAKELFESYLQGVFEKKVYGSKSNILESLCELIVDCEHKTAPTQETGYPSIRTPNVGKGDLILDNVNRVSYETYIKWTRRAVPKAGDLILAREAPAGNIAIIPDNLEVCLGQRTVLLRPKKDKLLSRYLAYLILSKDVQKNLLSHSIGATVQHVNMKDIRAFKVYNLSDLSEQQSIVRQLDSLKTQTQKLETVYNKKISDLEELKKSILQEAFLGKLTEKGITL
jgi:type I restriction enzyme, S subunit